MQAFFIDTHDRVVASHVKVISSWTSKVYSPKGVTKVMKQSNVKRNWIMKNFIPKACMNNSSKLLIMFPFCWFIG